MKYSDKNPPLVCMQTQSTCYKGTTTMAIKGVLWHSTGAPNTTLKRYVQPSDKKPSADTYSKSKWLEILGKNRYGNDWNHIDHQAGLNCWIGTLADGTVTTVQTMPWNYKPWGCGKGNKGSCNNGWIQFEICEDYLDDREYFNAVYEEACEITAYLCKKYNIDPKAKVTHEGVKVPTILCHADSHKLGLGNNHGDVLHWFPKFGKDMDDVRNDVAKLLADDEPVTPPAPEPEPEPDPEPTSNMKLLNTAKGEIGYYTTGDGNKGTLKSKYAEYIDKNFYFGSGNANNFYNGKKNGYHWCAMFVDWCFLAAFGEDTARKITYHKDTMQCGAGCEFSARAYYTNGKFFTSNPQPGDEIFFDWGGGGKATSANSCSRADHTGIVFSVDGDKIITIEGNTGDTSGHYSAVAYKTHYVSSKTVMGFGRPNWDVVEDNPEYPQPDPEPEDPDIPPVNPDPDVPPEEPELPDPPTVSAISVNRIFTEHVIVEVYVSGDEISDLYYSLNGSTTSLAVNTGSITFKIEDLVPNTNYSITVVAENAGGSDSATTSFKTLQDYPSPIQGISLKSTASTNNEADLFSATVSPPERWGYWKDKAGHDYGYRLFLVSNCRLLAYKDVAAKDKQEFIPLSSFGTTAIKHEDNLQAGIITWVIDNTNSKIFDTKDAGTLYPVCSNSICLKELSEMSDILYFSDSGAQRRTQPYMDGQPVKIFKI